MAKHNNDALMLIGALEFLRMGLKTTNKKHKRSERVTTTYRQIYNPKLDKVITLKTVTHTTYGEENH